MAKATAVAAKRRLPLHIVPIPTTIATMAMWTIRAHYDQETACWWVLDSDVPGLAADAATLEKLADKIGTMLPDLLAIHADQLVDEKRRIGPHKLRIIAHHEHLFDVAA